MEFRLPEIGEGVYEAELVEWFVQPGDTVEHGHVLAEVMTDKAAMEVPSPFDGTIESLGAETGQLVEVGRVILAYTPSGDSVPPVSTDGEVAMTPVSAKVPAPEHNVISSAPPSEQMSNVRAAPSVRRMAGALGLDLAQVHASGEDGQVLLSDLAAHIKARGTIASSTELRPATSVQDFGSAGTSIKFHGLRRKIAERMVAAKRTVPHYTYIDECDVTELVKLRESLKRSFASSGVRLTYLPFLVKAAVAALKEVPIVNASLDEEAEQIVLHDTYHIGIATATPRGLVVPVLREADRKSLREIAVAIDHVTAAARSGEAQSDALRGSTFTITSIGGIGGLISTPIINHPEVAILGVGKIVRRPVFDDDSIRRVRPADLVYLSFSFDHRVVDGAVGAAFGNSIIQSIQNPSTLLLEESGT